MNASKAPTILGGETMAQIQLVVFELNGEEYGVDALAVSGILRIHLINTAVIIAVFRL